MSDIETLLKDFLIFTDSLPNSKEEYLKSEYGYLDIYLRVDETWDLFFQNNFNIYVLKKILPSLPENERITIFKFGIACLIQFINCNFTGPGLEKQTEDYLKLDKFLKIPFMDHLTVVNEEVNMNTKHPALLFTAKIIFEHCIVNDFINSWWRWRCILIHQNVLDDLSQGLLLEADCIYKCLDVHLQLKGM